MDLRRIFRHYKLGRIVIGYAIYLMDECCYEYNEDECFMVIKGSLDIELRDKTISLSEGEFYIVPKGVEHKPIAKEEVHIVLFEPLSIKHTGDIVADITVETYESI